VLDLSWVMVGPVSGRYLADLGADVVKIESARRIDPLRTLGPFKDGRVGRERSVSYHNLNAGKRSLAINIRNPRGREIILRLAEWADVVLESFTPGVLDDMGLAYADISKRNARVIMVSTSILGQTGPHAVGASGVGTMGAAMSGATFQLGWPDRPPVGPWGPWTDAVAPRFIVASILAALHRRRRTGEGCYIDVAQAEAGIQFMTPSLYEYAANGIVPQRRGADIAPTRVPCGVYPCAGDDKWIAIDASDAKRFEALRNLIGGDTHDRAFDTLIGRIRARERLDNAIADWTRTRIAEEVERQLQEAGVAAHTVSRAGDLARDAHVLATNHLRRINDPVIGEADIEGPRFALARTPHAEIRRGPRIGEHNNQVLRELCGMSDAEIAQLADGGVLETNTG